MSANSIIQLGQPGLIEQPTRRKLSTTGAWSTTRTWKGLEKDVLAFMSTLPGGVEASQSAAEPPYHAVEVNIPDPQDGSDPETASGNTLLWTWAGNDLEKDIFDSAAFADLSSADQESLRQYRDGDIGLGEAPSTGDGGAFANLITAGSLSFTISQFVLRREWTLSALYVTPYNLDNANRQFTPAKLISTYAVPEPYKTNVTDAGGAWLERTLTDEQLSDGHRKVVQEWWHAAEWSTLFYPVVI